MTHDTTLQYIPTREIIYRFVDLLLLVLGNWLAYMLVLQVLPAAESEKHMGSAYLLSVIMYAVIGDGFRKLTLGKRFVRISVNGIVLSATMAVVRMFGG
ncbi:MAG: hypothetical protein HY962_08235 [Ignavibacteriae bacterium]|nr:hypothetical protein [Ignavibacteriota bacterium]